MLEGTTSAAHSRWSAARIALVADALRGHGHLRLRVHGESMLPRLWPGDMVEIEGCSPEDVRPGEIVLALREDRLFLHRLVAPCTANGFLLRGDSVPRSDSFPPDALLGRLVSWADERPGASAAALRTGLDVNWIGANCSRALGMLLCHCTLARRLALKLHSRRRVTADESRRSATAAEPGVL
ncbi:MAG: S24/S26 family peptidase [Acidobacteriia bacterium]|nr:S24/S26 family peptidase [Terriglobia bacterium]